MKRDPKCFDTLRSLTDDPILLHAIRIAEDELALERADATLVSIRKTLKEAEKVDRDYRAWLRRPRCWWCGRR